MIDGRVSIAIDSQVVRFNVRIDTRNNKPVQTYKVDENGLVSEVKPEGEQVEMDLGIPKEEVPTKLESKETERHVVDEFIVSGLAPHFEDLDYDFTSFVRRLLEGETYLKIANELNLSSGKVAEMIEDYRTRVAPLAQKWDEWRQGKVGSSAAPTPAIDNQPEPEEPTDLEDEQKSSDRETGKVETVQDPANDLNESLLDPQAAVEITPAKIEAFILEKKPHYPDIAFDFAALLDRRKNGGDTWNDIASSLNVSSGKLQTEYQKYKARVKEEMHRENGAA